MAGSLTSFLLIKYTGRRKSLIGGSLVCGLSMLLFAIVAVAAPGSEAAAKCLVAFVSLFIFSYGATWGPVTQVVVGEISSTKLRSKTISLGTSVGWLCDILIVCRTPYLIDVNHANLGAKVGFIFGSCEVVICLWTCFVLPETKDRSLEEIVEMFLNVSSHSSFCDLSTHDEQGISTHKFRSYVATGEVRGLSVQGQLEKLEGKQTLSAGENTVELIECVAR